MNAAWGWLLASVLWVGVLAGGWLVLDHIVGDLAAKRPAVPCPSASMETG